MATLVNIPVLSSSRPLVAPPQKIQRTSSMEKAEYIEQIEHVEQSHFRIEEITNMTAVDVRMQQQKQFESLLRTLKEIQLFPFLYFVALILGSAFIFIGLEGDPSWCVALTSIISFIMFRVLEV